MSEGSFMEMINKYFTDQDLAELLRSKIILAVPMSCQVVTRRQRGTKVHVWQRMKMMIYRWEMLP